MGDKEINGVRKFRREYHLEELNFRRLRHFVLPLLFVFVFWIELIL